MCVFHHITSPLWTEHLSKWSRTNSFWEKIWATFLAGCHNPFHKSCNGRCCPSVTAGITVTLMFDCAWPLTYVWPPQHSGVNSSNTQVLTLYNVTEEESGEYICKVANYIGQANQSAWLTVVKHSQGNARPLLQRHISAERGRSRC